MRFVTFLAFSLGTTFLLPPVSFVTVLKLSMPLIHSSERVQYSTPGLFFLYVSRCLYLLVLISFSETFFACAILDALSVLLMLHSSLDVKIPRYLN